MFPRPDRLGPTSGTEARAREEALVVDAARGREAAKPLLLVTQRSVTRGLHAQRGGSVLARRPADALVGVARVADGAAGLPVHRREEGAAVHGLVAEELDLGVEA